MSPLQSPVAYGTLPLDPSKSNGEFHAEALFATSQRSGTLFRNKGLAPKAKPGPMKPIRIQAVAMIPTQNTQPYDSAVK